MSPEPTQWVGGNEEELPSRGKSKLQNLGREALEKVELSKVCTVGVTYFQRWSQSLVI